MRYLVGLLIGCSLYSTSYAKNIYDSSGNYQGEERSLGGTTYVSDSSGNQIGTVSQGGQRYDLSGNYEGEQRNMGGHTYMYDKTGNQVGEVD
jgi:hypothetical protein